MARYWVGDGGNWNDTNHWSLTSGGSSGADVPTSADDVYFDALSFTTSATVTINATADCLSMDWTGATNTPVIAGSSALNIYGNLTLISGMTITYTGTITFKATSIGKTITLGGKTLASDINFNGVSGGWTLQDTFNIGTKALTLTNGTLNTNGVTTTCGRLSSTGTGTRTLTLGASLFTCTQSITTEWDMSGSNLTFNANTSTVTLQNGGLTADGQTFSNVVLSASSSQAITGSITFTNLTRTGGASQSASSVLSGNLIITGTLTLTGNSATNRTLVRSNTLGTTRTITAATVSLTNTDCQDITGAGAPTWSGTSVGNALGNSGIPFTTPVTRYWVGGTGSWSSTGEWSDTSGGASGASVPLCHDTVVFDANSFSAGSQTVTANMSRLGAGIDFTGVLNTPALSVTTSASVFGALTLVSGMTSTSGTNTLTFAGRSSLTFTTGGITINCPATVTMFGGALTLSGDLTLLSSRTLTLSNGTLDANGNNVTTGLFSSSNSNTRTLTMGSGTWTLNGTGTLWSTNPTNFTLSAGTSTIVISDTSSTSKFFDGQGRTFNNLTVT